VSICVHLWFPVFYFNHGRLIQDESMNKMLYSCALLALIFVFGCKPKSEIADAPTSTKPTPVANLPATAQPAPDVLAAKEESLPAEALGLLTTNAPLTDGDKAWMELLKAMEPPEAPAEWETTTPSQEVLGAFQRTNAILVAQAADKARQFYTKYPDHARAADARERERFLLDVAAQLGNTNVAARIEALDEAQLKDPKLPEEERFELRLQQVERVLSRGAEAATSADLDKMEASVRAFQKEYTNRTELAALLLTPAEGRLNNSEPEKARALAAEAAAATSEPEVQEAARSLLKKINRIGKPLEMKFKAVDGREVDVQAMKGKVVLVDFWATWCGPCMKELPSVRAAYEKLHSKGFEIIGVSFDHDKAVLERVLKSEKMEWPQHFDEDTSGGGFGEQFNVEAIPAMWLIDKKGNLRDVNARENLAGKVEKLLSE
jgi:thiol-disulfide isomerase/thioredoxin